MAAIDLDDSQRSRCQSLVIQVFDLFTAWVAELLAYANTANMQARAA